jgi:hypothetical protein
MKVFLLHRDRDIDLDRTLPPNEAALTQDLELPRLFKAMAPDDEFLFDIARRVVLASVTDPDTIVYRQRVLSDCLAHPSVVRQMYDIAVDALQSPRRTWFGILFRDSPDTILRRSVQILQLLVGNLKQLRQLADEHAADFHSDGYTRFFRMLDDELDDEYFATIDDHLAELKMSRGVLMSAELGKGNTGVRYVLHRPARLSWWERLTGGDRVGFGFQIPPRDEAGAQALSELESRGVNLVANALAQSTDHVLSFFRMLRAELAFYLGCLQLHERLSAKGEPVCFPDPLPPGRPVLSACGLYDVGLALTIDTRTVGNDVDADGAALVMITGANQGGKSTFLRSAGLAQLMMQSGMFVPAESFAANVCRGVFTHFKREEDATMTSGKLDEELGRMSEIADQLGPTDLLLCNESFGSTNEREGSEIGRQVVRALTEAGVKVLFVTHLYDLAHGLYRKQLDTALFLRAERRPDGRRTFRLVEGEPLPTSYGEDSYRRIFGTSSDAGQPADIAVSVGEA